jgi:hypothetical protein
MKPSSWCILVFFSALIVGLLCFIAYEAGLLNLHQCSTQSAIGNVTTCNGCPEGTMLVGSKESSIYHACNCTYAEKITDANRLCFRSISDAEGLGYKPCSSCLKSKGLQP